MAAAVVLGQSQSLALSSPPPLASLVLHMTGPTVVCADPENDEDGKAVEEGEVLPGGGVALSSQEHSSGAAVQHMRRAL